MNRRVFGMSISAFVLCVLLGVALGTGAYTYSYGEGFSYFSSDPKACVNCHVMREHYDGWQKASHHAVAVCNDCHMPHDFLGKYWTKAENGFWHSRAFTFQDFHEPIRIRPVSAKVLQVNCVTCHRDMVADILGHDSTGEDATNCVHCHAAVGHGPQR